MRVLGAILVGLVVGVAGCGRSASPANPDRAGEALRQALDAWQRGDQPSALRSASPAINVSDPEWTAGYRLTSYQLGGTSDPAGFDLRFPVTLNLKDPMGKSVRKATGYVVSTHPVLTVVRNDPDS